MSKTARRYYNDHNFNCAETIIHAANAYYGLGLHEEDMKMLGIFGSGMYVGNTCGALTGCMAALSKLVLKNKAHEELDTIRPAAALLHRKFNAAFSETNCSKIKPVFWNPEIRCQNTVCTACDALEETVEELKEKGIIG